MGSTEKTLNLDFDYYRKSMSDQNVRCEVVDGNILKSMFTNEDGKRLCFILGTLLEDHLVKTQKEDCIAYGPVDLQIDEINIYQPDLVVYKKQLYSEEKDVIFVIQIMSAEQQIYDCLDKPFRMQNQTIKEYWLIDLKDEFVYAFTYGENVAYHRYRFDQNIPCTAYAGLNCCIYDVLWQDRDGLRELALFYRYKHEIYPNYKQIALAEARTGYMGADEMQYTSEMFYDWCQTRKNIDLYTKMAELISGEIVENEMPNYNQQILKGNLYFAIKSFIKEHQLYWQMCFMPIAVELKKLDLLDSVVYPDLFMIHQSEKISGNIYKGVPEWIVEITTPATASKDYIDKAQIYQFHGVSEYWIINGWKKQVMVFDYKEDGEVEAEIYGFDDKIRVHTIEGLYLTINDIMI